MGIEDKIDIDVFKVVTRAVAESDDLLVMANHLSQLLTGAMDIKGCTIFALNPGSKELEAIGSFGLSISYISKGPVMDGKSVGAVMGGEPVVVRDVAESDCLQNPEDAKKEGIGAIVSVPILLYGGSIGALRLYHKEAWDISDRDLDSLILLGEIIGLAMTYTRMLNTLQGIKGTLEDLHPVWLQPGGE